MKNKALIKSLQIKRILMIPILFALTSVQTFAQYDEGDYSLPYDSNYTPPSYNPADFNYDPTLPSDASIIEYSAPQIDSFTSQFEFSPSHFSANMAALTPSLSNFTGYALDAAGTGLGPLEYLASSQFSNMAIYDLSLTAANSLLSSDYSLFNDRALEASNVMSLMAAYNTTSLNNSAEATITRTLVANMRLDDIRTDGTGLYLADGTYLGSLEDINVAQADAYLEGTVTDVGFCKSPVGICSLIMILKAREASIKALSQQKQGVADPYELFTSQALSKPGALDRLVLQFQDYLDSINLFGGDKPLISPNPILPPVTSSRPLADYNAAKNLPSLTGDSYEEAVNKLSTYGFNKSESMANGYEKWVSGDGSVVWFRPNGEIVRLGPATTGTNGKIATSQYDQYGNIVIGGSTNGGRSTGEVLRGSGDSTYKPITSITPDPIFTPNNGPNPGMVLTTPNNGPLLPTVLITPNNGTGLGTILTTPANVPSLYTDVLPGFCDGCALPRFDETLTYQQIVGRWKDQSGLNVRVTRDLETGNKLVSLTTPDGKIVAEGGPDSDGILNLYLNTYQLRGTPYAMSGREAFSIFYDANLRVGAEIKGLAGNWIDARDVVTNLDAFNKNIREGDTIEQAIWDTPTGHYAKGLGYTELKILYTEQATAQRPARVTIGPYRSVVVNFTKPKGP